MGLTTKAICEHGPDDYCPGKQDHSSHGRADIVYKKNGILWRIRYLPNIEASYEYVDTYGTNSPSFEARVANKPLVVNLPPEPAPMQFLPGICPWCPPGECPDGN